MQQIGFVDLARSNAIQSCEAAFRAATGVYLEIVPPNESGQRIKFGQSGNTFCVMKASHPAGSSSCREAQARQRRRAAPAPVQISCFAGLSEVAVPVVAGGKHVATLVSGPFLRRKPTERYFNLIAANFPKTSSVRWKARAHEAYFKTPVVTAVKLRSIIELLHILAQYLRHRAEQQAIAGSENELPFVARAKAFVQANADQPITLGQIATHLHLNRFYISKLFRKETGLTLTDYVARVRLEKAKSLLSDPSLRISEIAFAAGFGSIQQFNSVFKQIVGVSPTLYRAALRSQRSGGC